MTSPAMEEAVGLWRRGDSEAAVAVLREFVTDPSAGAEVVVFYSGLLLHLRRHEEARQVLTHAAARFPENASLLANLSIAQRKSGRALEGVATAKRALAHAPDLLSAWNALVIALAETGQETQARLKLKEAMDVHPDAPSLRHLMAQLAHEAGPSVPAESTNVVSALTAQAQTLAASGSLGPAEAVYRQILAIQPDHAHVRSSLGELLLLAGRSEEAAMELAAALRSLPSDAKARYLFAVASGSPPPVASTQYVRDLFDGMAETFDTHLQEGLGYRVPEQIANHLNAFAGERLGEVLDLGCGTGLVGRSLSELSQAIDGVDLSAQMLLRARARGCYRQLYLSEISDLLDETRSRWQTVTAADVFIYIGKIDDLFVKIRQVLKPGGCFAFSVERTSAEGFDVDPTTGRYRHSRGYLESALQRAGLTDGRFFETTIRSESGRLIPGWIVLARRRA